MSGIRRISGWTTVVAAVFATAIVVGGAVAPAPAIPLPVVKGALATGQIAASFSAAQQAQELGFPSIAIGLYRELLAAPGADRAAIMLPLATALLDAGEAVEAEQVLNSSPGPRTLEWRLRMGLAAAQQKHFEVAADQVRQIDVDKLTRPDRAWFWFLQATIADCQVPRDVPKANYFYGQAEKEAPNDMALATIHAAGMRVRLTQVPYQSADVEAARKAFEQTQDKGSRAYDPAEVYAVMRAATGGRSEAVRFLSELLLRIPPAEREWTDRFRRLLGMIGDRTRGGAGRYALTQLLQKGSIPDYQRQALVLLAGDSRTDPERGLFRAELDKLLNATPRSVIYDSVLLVRSQLALEDSPKDYSAAERLANQLKDDFPGSPLRPHAFLVLATSAWEQQRYRLAADNARQARELLQASPASTSKTEAKVVAESIGQLRVLEAEARYRAQDYRLAADAYAAALRDPPPGIPAGDLMFQEVLCAINADKSDLTVDLAKIVDQLEADKRFDPTNRWEAEWTLARGLRAQGRTDVALQRVTKLLAMPEGSDAVSHELRSRLRWLQAQLSFDAHQPQLTLELVPPLDRMAEGLAPELQAEIRSTAALLRAKAEFELKQEDRALQTLERLRAQYPNSDAAIYSYQLTADYYAQPGRDQIQKAQQSLQALIDDPRYASSAYVPYARYKLAQLYERLGEDQKANEEIEKWVDKSGSAPPDLVFAARLEQGDILRRLNQLPVAQRAYEALVNNTVFSRRADFVVAQLRLAECHNAQSSTDPTGSHADVAQALFEELLYRAGASADVRVEAGYNLGKMLERRGQLDKARDVWWRDVILPFLVQLKPGTPLGANQPYWLGKTLQDLGDLFDRRNALDEARRVYLLLRDSNLGYEETAIDRLQKLGVGAPAAEKP